SGFSAITAAIGPVMGGWLVEHFSWRAAFFINLPVAVIALVILYSRIPESRGSTGNARLDVIGSALVTAGLGLLVTALIQSSGLGWSHPLILGSLGGSVVFLIAFLWVEQHVADPIVPLRLFQSRDFSGANVLTFLLYGALGATFF